jgi:tetratricopeptide (TPR) repeat protein
VIYQRSQRFRDAEKVYRRATELNPRAAQPLINMGSLFIEEADARKDEGGAVVGELLDNALDALEASIRLNPRSAVAHYYLGTANYRSSFFDEAESNLKRAYSLDATMGSILLMLANVYIKQQRWTEVLECVNTYLQEYPDAPDREAVEDLREKVKRLQNQIVDLATGSSSSGAKLQTFVR